MSGIIKWNDPFFALAPIVGDIENYFSKDFWGSTTFETLRYISTTVPLINVFETDKEYTMEVLAPKLKKEDLIIEIEDNTIHLIPKETEQEHTDDSEDRLRKEYHFAYAERTFKLPQDADTKKIGATAENGIITIKIPKKEIKAPIKQQVKIE
jgi:HSP20 family protein